MTIDHAALLLIPPDSGLYFVMRLVGRITAPIFAFMLVEGFRHTRNRRAYLSRLSTFALIAQPFYSLMISESLNVLFTFAFSLMILWVIDSQKLNVFIKILSVGICLILSLMCDFGVIIPVWAMIWYSMRDRGFDFGTKAAVFALATFIMVELMQISFIQHGAVLALIPLYYYSGKRGGQAKNKTSSAIEKWGFYVYYPAHILILVALSLIFRRY
jgi:hypothetical protein